MAHPAQLGRARLALGSFSDVFFIFSDDCEVDCEQGYAAF
jgi:hypothetical protein